MDMSTSLFPEVNREIDESPQNKRLYTIVYTPALLPLRRPQCWDKHGATRTTRHVVSVVS